MITLFIACETTGAWQWRLPDNDPAQPHVVRVAAILEDTDGTVRTERCRLVQPRADWVFEEGAVKAHGIDAETALDAGFPREQVAAELGEMIWPASRMVGFGADFQARVTRRMLADFTAVTLTPSMFCCMRESREMVKKPRMQPGGGYAIPTFAETYRHIAAADLPTSDDPIEAGLLKVRAVRAIYDGLTGGRA